LLENWHSNKFNSNSGRWFITIMYDRCNFTDNETTIACNSVGAFSLWKEVQKIDQKYHKDTFAYRSASLVSFVALHFVRICLDERPKHDDADSVHAYNSSHSSHNEKAVHLLQSDEPKCVPSNYL